MERTCHRFDDLHVERALDLAGEVTLPRERVEAIQHALTSLLLNVRMHARATLVVVHLDATEPAPAPAGAAGRAGRAGQRAEADPPVGSWTLTVHDDGQGFDPAPGRFGVGLREVVQGELARRDIEVRIDSHVGVGTTVTIRGSWCPVTEEEPA